MKKTAFFIFLGFASVHHVTLWAGSLQDQIEQETERRQHLTRPLEDACLSSRKLLSDGKSVEACNLLSKAYQALPDSLSNTATAVEARKLLAKIEASLAKVASEQNHWPEARTRSLASLAYQPQNELALSLLQKSDEVLRRGAVGAEVVNPALTTNFFDRLNGVRTGLQEADAFRETGQLGKAEQRYEEVLQVDPFNQAATEGIKKIYEERTLVAEKAKDLSNLERKRDVHEAWNNIYPKSSASTGGIEISGALMASPTYALEKKMKNIVIPRVDFSGADLDTIRRALISLSRTYDPDAAKAGINFVVSSDVASSQPVTLKLRDTSLAEVVRYISQIAGVKARMTDIGVTFGPLVETRPDLIPRDFRVSPSFFKGFADSSTPASSGAKYGGSVLGDAPSTGSQNEQQKLAELGVVFPPGAYAVYNRNTSLLKVVNNAEMLDLISQLIAASEEETLLIQVGVRLVEINQSDLDSITVNSKFGTAAVGVPVPGVGVTNFTAAGGVGVNGQLNQIQGVGLLANNNLTAFLKPGTLAGTNSNASYSENTMTLGGFLNTMQFSSLITAISQKNSANVLANPSIVLKRGQEGKVSSVQEFRYVKEYNDPQSSVANIVLQGGVSVPGPETVLGSFPSSISDPVPIGVELGVKPDVVDNSRVLLELQPTFIDFEGNINYGAAIYSTYASRPFSTLIPPATNPVLILTNVIDQPVFVKRELKLAPLEVADGYTLLLGGLLREDIQKVDEKVPLLGDIPIFGRAFTGKTEQAVKKNTLIFVTPRILDVSGQPLNPTAGSPTTASTGGSP